MKAKTIWESKSTNGKCNSFFLLTRNRGNYRTRFGRKAFTIKIPLILSLGGIFKYSGRYLTYYKGCSACIGAAVRSLFRIRWATISYCCNRTCWCFHRACKWCWRGKCLIEIEFIYSGNKFRLVTILSGVLHTKAYV